MLVIGEASCSRMIPFFIDKNNSTVSPAGGSLVLRTALKDLILVLNNVTRCARE